MISLRGEFIPVMRLQQILEGGGAADTPEERVLLVLVASEGKRAAMAVDELLGQQQVVIKSLETHYPNFRISVSNHLCLQSRPPILVTMGSLFRTDSDPGPEGLHGFGFEGEETVDFAHAAVGYAGFSDGEGAVAFDG
ncbi:chemotaxis protein CheA [mine drainage metagenome]|uniref:Chemotaxis protein CheA n=1 Tax=mine drainage metagenome TaxID=410659 RepID=A0A1J5PPS5_9ZZZZ